jgi:hypothetical protein
MFDSSGAGFSEILSAIEGFVTRLEPAAYSPADVPVVLRRISRAEKLCATARLLMSRRAAELHAGDVDGTTSTAKWLAGQSGEGVGKARRDLDTAGKLASQPDLEAALRRGVVSPTQASVLIPALEADPEASRRLIDAAQQDSLNELRQACQRVVAAKRSEEEAALRDARLRERRYLHIGTTEEGAVSIRGELPPVEGAVVKNALEAVKRRIFDEARKAGRREAHEAYMADALVDLCSGTTGSTPGTNGPRAEIVLHVTAEALRRGELHAGEVCEIEGVGPVSLSTVEYLFGNAWAKLIINSGVNIASVTHFGRCIPAHLETALSKRDRVCAVPGCGISYGLERDHIVPVAEGGKTELANLVKLCRRHHYLKTHHFWRLTGRPGAWLWVNVRPQQEVVADGDLFDVALPGQPVAGLSRPILRPRDPVFTEDEGSNDDGSVRPIQTFRQQTLACSAMRPVVVIRLSSTPAGPGMLARRQLLANDVPSWVPHRSCPAPPARSAAWPARRDRRQLGKRPPSKHHLDGTCIARLEPASASRGALRPALLHPGSSPLCAEEPAVAGDGDPALPSGIDRRVALKGRGRLCDGAGAQYPRAIQSLRCGASSPIVVSSPCPVRTRVSGASTSRRVLIDSMIVGKSDQERPVAPGPPRNRVSPENTVPDSASYRQHPPGVCPGVCTTLSVTPPADSSSPSAISASGRASGYTSRQRGRSAGCMSTGALRASPSTTAALMWSLWPWVAMIADVRLPPTA